MELMIRPAALPDLPAVNELRRQVNDLHVVGKPEIFKPGFGAELEQYVYAIMEDGDKEIVVAEADGRICGFAVLHAVNRPENPYMFPRRFLDIDELCVSADCRRQGVGKALIDYACRCGREQGFDRLELNMWEFNRDALAFYEALGFSTYRRYLEMKL